MEKIIEELKGFVSISNEFSRQMCDKVIELVNKAGGKIYTINDHCDRIYGIVFDEGYEQYREFLIEEVGTDEITTAESVKYQLYIKGYFMAPRSLVKEYEESEEFTIFNGLVMYAPTLISICECIGQYVSADDEYSVFLDNGDEVNDEYLSYADAVHLADEYESKGYRVIIAKRYGGSWENIYETK